MHPATAPTDSTETTKMYSEKPSKSAEHYPDYEPQVDDWFWWWFSGSEEWGYLQKRADGIYEADGEKRSSIHNYSDPTKCLLATPPNFSMDKDETRHEDGYLLVDGKPTTEDGFRLYVEKPPSTYNPQQSYVPKVGEWFWRKMHDGGWRLRELRSNGTYNSRGTVVVVLVGNDAWKRQYKGRMLPAWKPKK